MRVSPTMEKFQNDESVDEISFLVPFFNFFYYLLLIPFKTVLDPDTNQYCIKTHCLHKILCPFFHAMVVFFMISFCVLSGLQFQTNSEPNIVTVFDFVSNFSSFTLTSLMIVILWRRRDKFLQVIESTRVTSKKTKTIKTLIYIITSIASITWGIINWFILHDPAHYGSLHTFDRCIMGKNASSSSHQLLSHHCPNILVNLLHTGFNILLVHASIFYAVAYGPFLMLIFTLGKLAKKFTDELDITIDSKIMDIQKGTELYRNLKRKTDLITELYGNGLLSYYITAVCYYAEAPHILLGKRGDTEKAIMVYFGCTTSVLWILGAEFHKNIQETVLKWIAVHTGNVNLSVQDRLKLVSLSNEMAADPIALASRYFCVTYQQFSSMLGLVVTYGIIVFQLYNGPSRREAAAEE
ncbi:unnamed protein product [Orchesella dallaii]|uniref:Gustatory receptor n=1 Tax=Orchesella dallaii TaxID=48710 RepID=A0ABP1QGN9_9HEXA